jgi:RHS repeat-associated protein
MAYGVEVVGNYAYLANANSSPGLGIIDISNPSTPTFKGNYVYSSAQGVQVVGNYAYLADGGSGLEIIDISNPTNPTLKGNYNTSGNAWGVQVIGNYAYIADWNSGLQIIDISNPTTPTLKGNYDTSGLAWDVEVVGNYAYLADNNSGLQIIDISNPTNPTLKGNYDTSGQAYDVQIVGNYAYLADNFSGLQIIDISNPTNPTLKGNYDTSGFAQDVQVVGNYAYVADNDSGLQIIDISNPTNPTLKGNYDTSGFAQDVQVVGNYAYVADYFDGLQIIDISNPTNPTLKGNYDTSGLAQDVQVVGNYAYVADRGGGLNIIDVSEFTNAQTVTLAISPSSVSEDGTANMAYTFTRSGVTTNALTVNYTVGGTATFSTDYTQSGAATFTSKTGTVTFAANSTTAKVTIDPTADTTVESDETVALTLAAGTGYKVGTTTPVTGTINDDELPIINLAVSPASVTEDGTANLIYTFTRSGVTTNPLTVNYTLGGTATLNTDYTRTGTNNTVTFAAGSSTATVTVDPTADTIVESNETVILTLAAGTGYTVGTTTPVTGTIFDLLSQGLKGQYYDGYFDDNLGFFSQQSPLLTRIDTNVNFLNNSTSWNLNTIPQLADLETFSSQWNGYINIPVTGNYTFYINSDDASYLFLDSATLAPTLTNVTINNGGLHVEKEVSKTVNLTAGLHNILLLYGENTVDNIMQFSWSSSDAKIAKQVVPSSALFNDDTNVTLPSITLAVSPSSVTEDGTTNLVYTVTRMGSTKNALTINYNLAGTATLNTDYTRTGTNNTVTFAAGSSTATVTVDPTADTTIEPNETVILTLAAGTGYTVGTTTPVTGTIVNDDTPSSPGTLSFGSPTFSINENGTPVTAVTVTRTGGSNGAVSATVKLTNGTATAPSDYNNNSITVNFANGEISKTVTVPIVNDTLPEPDETVQLILINPTSGATIGSQNTATLNIVDNDAAILITGFPQGSQGSNLGKSTIIIAGQNFSPTDKISIISPTGTETLANQVYWVNKTEAWATFNLQGLATGQYDVKVMNGINTYTSNDTFTVNNDPLGNLNIELSYPASGFVKVTYTNIGQTDLIAPLLRINATNATVNYPAENTISATLKQLLNLSLATSDNGPAGILAPGESGEFYFQYTPNGNGLINFTVNQVPANEVINWATIKAETRPDYSYIDTAAWDALWSNLTASLGTTAGQFQAVMAENANHLSQLGQETSDLTRLFAFEWKQAANTLTNVDLLSTTDVVDTAPGLSLSFNRTFYQSIAERYNLGTLGRGWSSQWDLRATTNSQGDVIIRSVGDLQRIFEKQTGDTYTGEGGATLTIVGGQYRLKEASGFISLFGSNGKLNYVEDTNGNRITLQYTNNNLTKLVHTNGDSLTLTYNAQGRINKITDSAGQATTYSYDTTGENLLSVTGVDGTITYTYDTGNVAAKKYSLLSVKSDLGYQRSFEYDNQGRLTKESSNGNTQTLTYSYDNVGGVTVTDSTGASQTVLLDDGGNAGQIRGVNNQNLLFNYDADGNLLGVTLPNGSQSSYSYDSKDNLTQQTNLLGQKTKFTYDATFNQLTSFTDPKGNGVGYSYDTKANLNKITYSDGSTQQFTVDALGNITSYINRRGSNISYTYNTSGLLTKKQYGNSSSVNYSYDTRGNLTSVVDGTGTMAMQYDTANRLTKITYPNGRSLSYTYNADGQRTKLVSSDGYTVNYTYDTVGRLKSLTNGTGQNIISYAYDSAGRLIKETNGNGTYTTYEYDLQDQLTKLVNYKANNTVNSKYEYTYDNLGRRTTMTTLEGVFKYGYDAIGQLTSVITPTNRTITYTYDAAGNRIGVTDSGVTTNYTTNNLNQYSNVGNGVYTYDTDGNLISKTQGGQTSNYTYDAESRLVKVVTPSGTWDYEYDGLGNRTATIFNGQKTEYLVDPFGLGDVVGEYNNNSLVANYTHGIGLVSRVNGNNSNYYDADAIGSTVGLTATDGSYVNKYSYLPFGEDLTKIEAVANPFEYVGQWGVTDEGNGLDFMRARFYDSSLGRFTSVDPINLAGGDTNFYRYVFNSPNTLIDPSGLSCKRLRDFGINYLETIILYLPFLIAGGVLGAAGASIGYAITVLRGIQISKLINRGAAIGGAIARGLEPIAESYLEDWLEENLWQCPPEPPPPPDKDFIGPPPPPPGPGGGGSWGDPHLTTFDGIKYDFQSVGEFTFVKSKLNGA